MATREPDEPVTAAQADAVLRWLPVLEREGFSAGEWKGVERRADVSYTAPWFAYSDEVDRFHRDLARYGFIRPFDWPAWCREVGADVLTSKEFVREADLETVWKLFTAHIRADRFNEGHLANAFVNGHIVALLRRLKELREAMDGPPADR